MGIADCRICRLYAAVSGHIPFLLGDLRLLDSGTPRISTDVLVGFSSVPLIECSRQSVEARRQQNVEDAFARFCNSPCLAYPFSTYINWKELP